MKRLLAASLLVCAGAAGAQDIGGDWLILQTAADPIALVGAASAKRAPGARVIATDDCVGMKPGMYVLAARPGSGARAPGAYIKRCAAKPRSVAALGLPAVDPSFAAMRSEPVNFDGGDIVSKVRAGLLLRPYYLPTPNDPREGLRMAVDDVAGRRRPIERDCTDPEVAREGDLIAIACAIEQVADRYVYRTTVYRAGDLKRVQSVPRCRNPRFVSGRKLRCDAQLIDADGNVSLRPRDLRL
ncbi:hypothetical protein QLH51_12075 [Sphingomonas sp. 2R-10]|uniref:hypothetical protein n=1 Tax=Sphingomonas sp. 2R-10 TaxID=3045148 RepID=UPI000F779A73|nr:hypothetical protein [Sphingomonas sp. 2R-10]MDJ0277532.1 hypothetical protein [Sphingomonas sp. 2R-10]